MAGDLFGRYLDWIRVAIVILLFANLIGVFVVQHELADHRGTTEAYIIKAIQGFDDQFHEELTTVQIAVVSMDIDATVEALKVAKRGTRAYRLLNAQLELYRARRDALLAGRAAHENR
jgi:hypothetical protein